jgi:hypothetical protein
VGGWGYRTKSSSSSSSSSSLARQPYVGPGLPQKLLPAEVLNKVLRIIYEPKA